MNKAKKLYVIPLIIFLAATTIPNVTEAKIIYGYTIGRLSDPVNGVYIMVYEKIGYEKDQVVLREIHARRCYKTPTEFRTVEMEDPLIITGRFTYNETNYLVKDLAALTLNDKVYTFAVANDSTTKKITFFATYTNDTGFTWSEIKMIANTSVSDSTYRNFDVAQLGNNIILAYSYQTGILNHTTVLTIDTQTLTVKSSVDTNDFFGIDFELLSYDDKIYLVSTNPENSRVVRFTYTTDGYNLSDTISIIQPPYSNITQFDPTITRWKNGFYIIGEDRLWGIVGQKAVSELFLWGRWIKDVGENNTISGYNVLGNKNFDGYFQKDPSANTYEGNVFVVFQEGKSISTGLTDLNFLFSSDGDLWVHQYSGTSSLIMNPAIMFAVTTVACFAVLLPVNYYLEKKKKK